MINNVEPKKEEHTDASLSIMERLERNREIIANERAIGKSEKSLKGGWSNMSRFTVEESNLIGRMYEHNSKRELLEELHETVLHIKETEMKALVIQVITKIEKMPEEGVNKYKFILEEE